MSLLGALWALGETLAEFLVWQEDWRKTSSPASYFIAVSLLVTLVVLLLLYGEEIWQYAQRLFAFVRPSTA